MKIITLTRQGQNIKRRAFERVDTRAHRLMHRSIAAAHRQRAEQLRETLAALNEDDAAAWETVAIRQEIDRCEIVALENENVSCVTDDH